MRILPTQRSEKVEYYVNPGDTLAKIALAYQVSVLQIIHENGIVNPDLIEMGGGLSATAMSEAGSRPTTRTPTSGTAIVAGQDVRHNPVTFLRRVKRAQLNGAVHSVSLGSPEPSSL